MKKNNCKTLLEGDRDLIICRQNLKSFSLTIAFLYAIVWDCVQCGKSTTHILFSSTRKECFAQNFENKTQLNSIVKCFALYILARENEEILGNHFRLGQLLEKQTYEEKTKWKPQLDQYQYYSALAFQSLHLLQHIKKEKKFSYTILKTLLYLYLLFLWDQ